MNDLHNPARSGQPPFGDPAADLVPSRYALRIGAIDALVVSDGVLPLPTATMATNAEPAALAGWLERMFMPPDAFDWPLNVMVARSGGQTILIDAGLGASSRVFRGPDNSRSGCKRPASRWSR